MKFEVAGHLFAIELPEKYAGEQYLMAYRPFVSDSDKTPLFSLKVETVERLSALNPGCKVDCFNEEPPYFWLFKTESGLLNFGFSYSKKHPDCYVFPDEAFEKAVLYVQESKAEAFLDFAISNAMMLLYTFRTNPYDTMLIHASVTAIGDDAYVFLGKSGTGKSTHSSLWLKHIEGTRLLNDDNPVIRVTDDGVWVYGTPWSGKTPCYKNERCALRAVVRLSQAPYNRIERQSPLQAYASLMPSCSCMRWDSDSVGRLHSSVEKVLTRVPVYHLECLPDKDAAMVCCKAVRP